MYTPSFFDANQTSSRNNARLILPFVLDLSPANSVIDIGCGTGAWASVFRELGIEDILGVDGDYVDSERLMIPKEHFQARDLAQPLGLDRRFDLAVCIEVAEHLPESRSKTFIEDICKLAPVVLFSAAIPRQGGTHHINEQWQDYWAERFLSCGYVPIDAVRRRFWSNPEVAGIYPQNMLLYASSDALAASESLTRARAETDETLLRVVHPRFFEGFTGLDSPENLSLRQLLGAIPKNLAGWANRRRARS